MFIRRWVTAQADAFQTMRATSIIDEKIKLSRDKLSPDLFCGVEFYSYYAIVVLQNGDNETAAALK